MEDCCRTFHVGLSEFPRFCVGEVFITDPGEIHCLFLRLSELEVIEQVFEGGFDIFELLNGCLVIFVQFSARGHASIKIFIREHERAIDEVAIDSYEFVVVACLKIRPCEVIVLGLRRISSEDITEHILFSGEILEVLVEPNRPVA